MNIGEEDIAQSKPAAQAKQDTQASAILKSSGTELAITNAYDTSFEDKQVAVASSKAVAGFKKTTSLGSSMLDTAVRRCNVEVIEYQEDVYEKGPDPDVDVMTEEALKFVKLWV